MYATKVVYLGIQNRGNLAWFGALSGVSKASVYHKNAKTCRLMRISFRTCIDLGNT